MLANEVKQAMTWPIGPQWQTGDPENGALTGINRSTGLSTLPTSIQQP